MISRHMCHDSTTQLQAPCGGEKRSPSPSRGRFLDSATPRSSGPVGECKSSPFYVLGGLSVEIRGGGAEPAIRKNKRGKKCLNMAAGGCGLSRPAWATEFGPLEDFRAAPGASGGYLQIARPSDAHEAAPAPRAPWVSKSQATCRYHQRPPELPGNHPGCWLQVTF